MAHSRLGPLALESRLGDATRSSVWRAIHVQQRRPLAVKIFHLPFGGTPEARQEFAREWEMLKRLRHGAIARCYGGGFENNDAYLAYEIVDGESLRDRVERRERLPWETVLDEAEVLAEGLDYAHQRQVVHGDLVPDKIRTSGLAPVILDFRVDRYRSAYHSPHPPSPFELAFRAPELLRDPANVAPKSDLYSLGALLYYALSGRPPITGADASAVTTAAQTQVPPKIASLVLDCPIWLSSLIDQLLDKNPAARPHSAAAVTLALREVRRRAAEGVGVAQHASAGFSPLRVDVDKDEARALLGHLPPEDESEEVDATPLHERAWFLMLALVLLAGVVTWFLWPLNDDQMRERAEALIAEGNRTSLGQAKDQYLQQLVTKFPDSPHASWARDQIELIDMLEAERVLEMKLRRGSTLSEEGERLYAAAREYEQFGDSATALDKYTSLVTLLGDDPKHRPYVNLARRQIAKIRAEGNQEDERQQLVTARLAEADRMLAAGETLEARKIWYSIVELYDGNLELEPLVKIAYQRLAGSGSDESQR